MHNAVAGERELLAAAAGHFVHRGLPEDMAAPAEARRAFFGRWPAR
ncbi:hypothetical protein [Streptomyces sp. 372A]